MHNFLCDTDQKMLFLIQDRNVYFKCIMFHCSFWMTRGLQPEAWWCPFAIPLFIKVYFLLFAMKEFIRFTDLGEWRNRDNYLYSYKYSEVYFRVTLQIVLTQVKNRSDDYNWVSALKTEKHMTCKCSNYNVDIRNSNFQGFKGQTQKSNQNLKKILGENKNFPQISSNLYLKGKIKPGYLK